MSKNTLILLGGAVVLIIGFIMMNNRQSSSSLQNSPQEDTQAKESPTDKSMTDINPEAITIEYRGDGFSPKEIAVTTGTTVIFRNNTTKSMWIASNPHPVHTNFSAFDAKKGFGEGESYSFTFEKAGEYGYHNHLSPLDGGTIIVK